MTSLVAPTRIPAMALQLTVAGVLPFVVAALSQWVAMPRLDPARGLFLGLAYGAVSLSFLGGIRWGIATKPSATSSQALEFIGGILPPLAGFLVLTIPPIPGLCLLIASFLMQALWDVTSVEHGRLPQYFGKLRMLLTAGAVISLIAMLVPQTI